MGILNIGWWNSSQLIKCPNAYVLRLILWTIVTMFFFFPLMYERGLNKNRECSPLRTSILSSFQIIIWIFSYIVCMLSLTFKQNQIFVYLLDFIKYKHETWPQFLFFSTQFTFHTHNVIRMAAYIVRLHVLLHYVILFYSHNRGLGLIDDWVTLGLVKLW